MGAWSTGPLDNDTAADFMAGVMRKSKLPKIIEKGLKGKCPEEVRAAAVMLEHVGYSYMYDVDVLDKHLILAVEKLQDILENKVWVESWNYPANARLAIREQILKLVKRFGDERLLNSTGLMEAIAKENA